jgi:hypothetical protein
MSTTKWVNSSFIHSINATPPGFELVVFYAFFVKAKMMQPSSEPNRNTPSVL